MSTIEDFKNAPIGATATHRHGGQAMKINDGDQYWITRRGSYLSDEQMGLCDYTLDSSVPATAREALDLAWELAHEVKPGQIIPKGAQYLELYGSCVREYAAPFDIAVNPAGVPIRTVEPLSEPEPDWLDAPAVLARLDDRDLQPTEVFTPTGLNNLWIRVGTSWTFHWKELRDVTPLYPKEDA